MKAIKSILISFLFLSFVVSCNSQTSEKKKQTEVSENKIEVYYFHYTRRCVTCNAVENETKKALKTLYADHMKSGKIIFQSLNLEDDSSDEIVEKLDVSGQSLLIVKGDKKFNLTNDGFMNARSRPEKFKAKIKTTIEKLM